MKKVPLRLSDLSPLSARVALGLLLLFSNTALAVKEDPSGAPEVATASLSEGARCEAERTVTLIVGANRKLFDFSRRRAQCLDVKDGADLSMDYRDYLPPEGIRHSLVVSERCCPISMAVGRVALQSPCTACEVEEPGVVAQHFDRIAAPDSIVVIALCPGQSNALQIERGQNPMRFALPADLGDWREEQTATQGIVQFDEAMSRFGFQRLDWMRLRIETSRPPVDSEKLALSSLWYPLDYAFQRLRIPHVYQFPRTYEGMPLEALYYLRGDRSRLKF